MPGPVARVHALSLGHATTLRARRACTHTYIAFRSQTRRLGALSALRILFTCRRAAAVLLHHAPAPLRSTNSEARATATCVGKRRKFLRPTREAATGCRTPCPRAGSAWVASRGLARASDRPEARRHCGSLYGVCGIPTCTCRNSYIYKVLEYMYMK